ncbi:MAG: TRAP transporter small permease subunit [Saprospiraceae bacterium]
MEKWVSRLNEGVGKAVSWLSLVLVLLVFGNVWVRYVLNEPRAWSKELEWHVFSLLFLLAAGYSLQRDKHVRVDLFYERMGRKDQGAVNFWGTLLLLIPWCVVLVVTGWQAAVSAWEMGERSAEAGGLPNLWLIQFALPAGMLLLLLQGVVLLIRSYRQMRENSAD